MIKINFVVHTYDKSNRGGVLRVVSMLANYFVNQYHVEIISFGIVEEEAYALDSRVKVTSLYLENYNTVFYDGISKLKWFKDAYHKIYPCISEDNVIWITSSPPISLLFSLIKIINRNIKVIGCDHTSTIYEKNFFIQKIRNLFLSKLNCMVGLNPQDVDYYSRNNIKSVWIPNGIDLENIAREKSAFKYLLYVGRFNEEKQPFKAIDLFVKSDLPKQGIILRMYGHGDLKWEINDYIESNNYAEYVEVISGETDLDVIYKDAFALLLTSKIEGFPLVLLEAISKNIPCLSFRIPYGPLNIIKNGINGYFFEDSVEDFSEKISALHSLDRSLIYKSIEEYDFSEILKKWNALLLECSE
ncbi:hypothetical protein A7P54_18490 [Acinetobacter sp. Ac_3412]|uniref:glycosyltransferase n=1 Tax=Acinetobacter sp. Ac_3412 TaxID=1848935 RepID=UPI00148FB559|nr:glycosyltransferase [Acinetobacter sp. Ac_3412]NNP75076.1 hypothetical protein [Acinetobacter sp. Ac_3412]